MEEKIGRIEKEDPMFQNLKTIKAVAVKENKVKDQESVSSSRLNVKVSIRSGITSNRKIQHSEPVNGENQLLVDTPDDRSNHPEIGIDLESGRMDRTPNQKIRTKKKKKSRGQPKGSDVFS